MRCKICQNEFIPNKYRPQQQVCFQAQCQKQRQIQNERAWRISNPDYFKCLGQEAFWQENRRRYSKLWRVSHKEYHKEYEASHKQQRREYMRDYMRRYREAKSPNVNTDKS